MSMPQYDITVSIPSPGMVPRRSISLLVPQDFGFEKTKASLSGGEQRRRGGGGGYGQREKERELGC